MLSSRDARVFASAALLVVVLGAPLTVVLLSGAFSVTTREIVSSVVTDLFAVAIPVTCVRAAVRSSGRIRWAWQLMSVTGVLWVAGEISWLGEEYLDPRASNPPWSDIFYLLALLPAAAALLAFPTWPWPGRQRLRSLLGTVVVAASLLFISRALALSVIFPTATGPALAQVLTVAYPLADLMLASFALVLLIRLASWPRLHLVLISLGFLYYAIGDTAYLRMAALGTYTPGSPIDLVWAFGYAFFLLAPLAPSASASIPIADTPSNGGHYGARRSLLVYLPLLVAIVIGAFRTDPVADPVLIISGITALVAFGFRQALLSADNGRLGRALLVRVGELEQRSSALRRLARQNEQILQSVVDGVLGVGADGRVTFANERAAAMLGRPVGDIVGTPEQELFDELVDEDPPSRRLGREVPMSAVGLALFAGTVVHSARTRFRKADGTSFPVELAVGPILEADDITGGVVVFRDVSARLAVEKMKDEFVSVVSHELRTPLTSIRGSLGLLAGGAGGQLSPTGDRMVTIALQSSERLTRLIDDMLDIERMESGSLALQTVDCAAAELVGAAVNEVRMMAQQGGVRLLPGRLGGTVRGDRDRVVQVLTNLLANAVKFSPRGGRVRISSVRRAEMVEFAVNDDGRGVPLDKVFSIFERFEQVDSSDSRQQGGTGLGLAISRDIVRLHGGRIWVESEPGHGATFRFTLPVAQDSSATSIPDDAPATQDAVSGFIA